MHSHSYCFNCMERTSADPCPSCHVARSQAAPEHPLYLPAGTLIGDRYLLGRVLGKGPGGFGITYLGVDTQLGYKVAVKEYLPRDLVSRNPRTKEIQPLPGESHELFRVGLSRFRDEGRHLARFIEHPNVVSVVTFIEERDTGYLVMRYVDGRSLQEYVEKLPQSRLATEEAYIILMQILDGLSAVHEQQLLHRDIKPLNIYLTSEGQTKLLDFGSARQFLGEATQDVTNFVTPSYSPPELYDETSHSRQGPWTDIYGTGATAYFILSGRKIPNAPLRSLGTVSVANQASGIRSKAGVAGSLWAIARKMSPASPSRPAAR